MGIGRQAFEKTRTQLASPMCIVISSVVFTNSWRRRRPGPILTNELAASGRISDMGRTSIGHQAFEPTRTQLVSPTCKVISSAVFTNSFAVGLAMESSTLTNLLAVARLVPSLLF